MNQSGRNNAGGWAPFLDQGEEILWEGHPPHELFLLTKSDFWIVPCSLIWVGGMIYTILFNVFPTKLDTLIVVSAMAIYITVGRFFVARYIRQRTSYFLSNYRAFIASHAFGKRLRELRITPDLSMEFEAGARGSIRFDSVQAGSGWLHSLRSFHGFEDTFGFFRISDAENVLRLIRQIQRGEP